LRSEVAALAAEAAAMTPTPAMHAAAKAILLLVVTVLTRLCLLRLAAGDEGRQSAHILAAGIGALLRLRLRLLIRTRLLLLHRLLAR
jgi:hypothetical protein